MSMLILDFFTWWYSTGWLKTVNDLKRRSNNVLRTFSVFLLIKTLFKPWRRIITYPGQGLKSRLSALIDNSISRVIGFVIRLFTIIAAFIVFIVVNLISLLSIIIWPILPILIIIAVIKGIVG
jgi:hypothetical protein